MRRNDKTRGAILRIKSQFKEAPEEGEIMFQVVHQAIKDLTAVDPYDIFSAKRFLKQPVIPHADLCNVESDWIRLTLKRAGVRL